jgi:hypothetical protein
VQQVIGRDVIERGGLVAAVAAAQHAPDDEVDDQPAHLA